MIKSFISEREKHRYYNSLSEEQKYDAFNDILFESEHVVFLGGAGVSTESGIPDFRSKNGLYKKRVKAFGRYKPEYLLSSECKECRAERGALQACGNGKVRQAGGRDHAEYRWPASESGQSERAGNSRDNMDKSLRLLP